MGERWRVPVIPLAIDDHPSQGIYMPDGRVLGDQVFTLKPEDTERMRLGYVCIRCFEPQEVAYPERCVCGYPMRREQAALFAAEYAGEVRLGPSTSLEEERAGIAERLAKEEEAKRRGDSPDPLVH